MISTAPVDEKRGYPRLSMHGAVFVVQGETAYLTELLNVSAGGVCTRKPARWQIAQEPTFRLFVVLEDEKILCIQSRVIHERGEEVGFEFLPGYAIEAELLLTESARWLR